MTPTTSLRNGAGLFKRLGSPLVLNLSGETQSELGAFSRATDEYFAAVHEHDGTDNREAQTA